MPLLPLISQEHFSYYVLALPVPLATVRGGTRGGTGRPLLGRGRELFKASTKSGTTLCIAIRTPWGDDRGRRALHGADEPYLIGVSGLTP